MLTAFECGLHCVFEIWPEKDLLRLLAARRYYRQKATGMYGCGKNRGTPSGALWRTNEKGELFETYDFVTGACGLTGEVWQIESHAIPPEESENIFRRTFHEPRKQTQNL